MARIRSLKPEQPKDELLAALPIATRYLFAFLPTHADREGRLEDRPRVLKLEIFPWDDVDVESMLAELAPHFIIRYETGGRRYIQIRQFIKHQRPNNKELPSDIEAPTKEQLDERFIQKKGSLIQKKGSLIQSEGIRECVGKGKGRSYHETSFVEFWTAYPKKQGKAEALKAWLKLAPDPDLVAVIIPAVLRQAAQPDAGRDGWKYFKHAQGWLNGRRWEDNVPNPPATARQVSSFSLDGETPEDRDFRIAAEKHVSDMAFVAEDERKDKVIRDAAYAARTRTT